MSLKTYQDFIVAADKSAFIIDAISEHKASEAYRTAVSADAYDRQRNETILSYVQTIFTLSGNPVMDFTAANNRITSNYFRRLNTQRNTYSLGNGVTFKNGGTKDRLGLTFDTRLKEAGYCALIHGVSFCFWNFNKLHVFPLTEFVPLWDEDNSELMAGIRFWQIAPDKPLFVVLYETDGYTKYKGVDGKALRVEKDKASYKQRVAATAAYGEETIGGDNYSALPIVPLWGSTLKQSTLIGMQSAIDSYDLIRSGFANDLTDCAQIFWIVENCGGMSDEDLQRLRDRMKLTHMLPVDTDSGASVKGFTQEIPFNARAVYLDSTRAGIYEDFGGLDTSAISASSKTATEINAAYQPLDENADDYEYQLIECVQRILALQGIEDTPIFKRNRISNQLEQVQMVALEAPYLDDETILKKLPNITPDEVKAILAQKDAEGQERFDGGEEEEQ